MFRTDLWVAAFVRRHNDLGEICVVVRRGDPIAGQIFIEVDHLNGRASLLTPAPATAREDGDEDRIFVRRFSSAEPKQVAERITREIGYDPDLWVISLETRGGEVGVTEVGA
jgi:hypothetical protein